jgi:hypothetical protein
MVEMKAYLAGPKGYHEICLKHLCSEKTSEIFREIFRCTIYKHAGKRKNMEKKIYLCAVGNRLTRLVLPEVVCLKRPRWGHATL